MSVKLVWNEADCRIQINGLTLQAAPRNYPPFSYQALVVEQDTNLLLGEQTQLNDPGQPAWYLANTIERDQPEYQTGTVLYKPGKPARLLAIIHDIENTPTCTEADITAAWQCIKTIIEEKQLRTFATPVLGTVHGKIEMARGLTMLKDSLLNHLQTSLEKIWLILPDNMSCEEAKNLLQHN